MAPVGREVKASVSAVLKEYDHRPVEERIALYYQLKKESPEAYNFKDENAMTMYGYSLLWAGHTADALAIFKLIAAEFPDSANAYDSLGEAYLKIGDKEASLANYQKSLAMNPDNFNAEDQIERIQFPDQKPVKPAEKFGKVYSARQYRDDLDQLAQKLLSIHPGALKFISKAEFDKIVAQKKALVTDATTFGEFAWHCSEIIASIGCSHTGMWNLYFERDMLPPERSFPVQTLWINGQLFVVDPLNNSGRIGIKDEILEINGVAVAGLVDEVYQHIPSQARIQTTRRRLFSPWSTVLIPYALGFPDTYTVKVQGIDNPVILNKAEVVKAPFRDRSIPRCDSLCFEVLKDRHSAVMTISTFNYYPWHNLDVFKKFVDDRFREIHEKHIDKLIIDLRFNGGGSMESSMHLLQYLVDKPFTYYSNVQYEGKTGKIEGETPVPPFKNRYKGKVFFIIDGLGNSTTGHFMSLVKTLKLGPIVGEELGSNQYCTAGQVSCRLKNTKLEYYIANNIHESSATALPDEVGILPDYPVTQSIDEYLNKVDAVKAFALRLLEK